jgi:hypothetical protein
MDIKSPTCTYVPESAGKTRTWGETDTREGGARCGVLCDTMTLAGVVKDASRQNFRVPVKYEHNGRWLMSITLTIANVSDSDEHIT